MSASDALPLQTMINFLKEHVPEALVDKIVEGEAAGEEAMGGEAQQQDPADPQAQRKAEL